MTAYKGNHFLGTEIIVNVYDLNESNNYLYDWGLGAYHSGVEIGGVEYSFGGDGGIGESTPRSIPDVHLRESISMGYSKLTKKEIEDVIYSMKPKFTGDSYNVLTKNCNCFSNDLCIRLGVGPIPGYINRMASWGSCCSCLLPQQMAEPPTIIQNFQGEGHKLESKPTYSEDSPLLRREKMVQAVQNRLNKHTNPTPNLN
ncbi:hypothetical protein WA158_005575 [Blastocystis sp. Blastoise]